MQRVTRPTGPKWNVTRPTDSIISGRTHSDGLAGGLYTHDSAGGGSPISDSQPEAHKLARLALLARLLFRSAEAAEQYSDTETTLLKSNNANRANVVQ